MEFPVPNYVFIIISFILLWVLSFVKNFHNLYKISLLGLSFAIFTYLIIMIQDLSNVNERKKVKNVENKEKNNILDIFCFIGFAIYAL